MLFLDNKIIQVLRQRKFVTETQTVIKQTEADDHIAILRFLVQRYSHLIIMVANLFHFTPNRLPSLIKSGSLGICQCKSIHQSRSIFQFQAEFRRFDNSFSFVGKFIDRFTLCVH